MINQFIQGRWHVFLFQKNTKINTEFCQSIYNLEEERLNWLDENFPQKNENYEMDRDKREHSSSKIHSNNSWE